MAASSNTKAKLKTARTTRIVGNPTELSNKDAIALLEADHREVEDLFEDYESLTDPIEKKALADRICLALKVHTQIEEELLYPPARDETGDGDLIDEALVEHMGAKTLIAQIEAGLPGQPLYDAKVKVLGEQVRHHVEEEEQELFPEVRATNLDLQALGEKLAARKAELMTLLAPAPPAV